MKHIVNLMFEARKLKDIPRTGYHYLEAGGESVAEHSFLITFIAFVMARLHPEADSEKLISMCLMHDLPEARIGDLNYVQKQYVTADEERALEDLAAGLEFGKDIKALVAEFNQGDTLESKLARDADQLCLILDLKGLMDQGYKSPEHWMPHVLDRLLTQTGKSLSKTILHTESDAWWLEPLTRK